ncbi:site-specific integrase [uncultured Roseobacter sp.]|uniref:tyrosine-type recombinase/integrase n=1 Tax=uncultured Roseobacter sp. TaxID=114847 RepID=UPI0026265F77|nr:site-specific integrase [uncultured Roseobacter sp.]
MTAEKLRGRVEAVLSWATVAGHREGSNPAAWQGNLKELLPSPGKIARTNHHGAISLSDAPRWWSEVSKREGMACHALRFAALTVARSGEVRGAKWDEIDFRASIWTIEASRMKARREHRVPLSADAIDLLNKLPRFEGNSYIFFAARGGPLSDMSMSAVMRRMQEAEVKLGRAGFVDPRSNRPAVLHGLRSTFRQWTAEQGCPRDMAEIALAHNVGSEVERAYQRSDMLERRRELMEDWASFLRGNFVYQPHLPRVGAV